MTQQSPEYRESERVTQNGIVGLALIAIGGSGGYAIVSYHLPWFVGVLGFGLTILLWAAGRNP